jgi:hypothetical protein
MLAMMESSGTITPAMRRAGLELRAVMMTGSRPVLQLLGLLGVPAAACVVHVLGRGWPLRQWARQGWHGRPLAQESASGILVGALAALAYGEPRLLLDQALAAAPRRPCPQPYGAFARNAAKLNRGPPMPLFIPQLRSGRRCASRSFSSRSSRGQACYPFATPNTT